MSKYWTLCILNMDLIKNMATILKLYCWYTIFRVYLLCSQNSPQCPGLQIHTADEQLPPFWQSESYLHVSLRTYTRLVLLRACSFWCTACWIQQSNFETISLRSKVAIKNYSSSFPHFVFLINAPSAIKKGFTFFVSNNSNDSNLEFLILLTQLYYFQLSIT